MQTTFLILTICLSSK